MFPHTYLIIHFVLQFFDRCTFSLQIKIKSVTKYNIMHDKYIPDYPCIVRIKGEHNHSTESASALRQLQILPETKKQFMNYFDAGKIIDVPS